MRQQLKNMLELQESMNSRVHPNWRQQGYEWYRAIWVECAELLDHYGWKWWKQQSPDIAQVNLELIDIWHFGLSYLLARNADVDAVADELAGSLSAEGSLLAEGSLSAEGSLQQDVVESERGALDFRGDLEDFALETLRSRGFDTQGFARLMVGVNLSFDSLYKGYIGKNVLNFFRQDHGYKEGSYQKQWGDKEDNEHLVELVQTLDASKASFQDDLYTALRSRYQSFMV